MLMIDITLDFKIQEKLVMKRKIVIVLLALLILGLVPTVALASDIRAEVVKSFDFAGPLFGLAAAPDGSLLVADAGAGIVEVRHGASHLVSELSGVTDIAPIGRGVMYAITGGAEPEQRSPDSSASTLFRVSRGTPREIADLYAFEAANNPAGGEVDSNPFDVAVLNGGAALVADAGGNDLLIIDQKNNVDWVATLPTEIVSTANAQSLLGCPDAPPDFQFICTIDYMPAEPVATSVAIGPDGAYYVGELKGFPAPIGVSKVWRIEPGTRHAECGTSPACTVVYDNFTSVIDLAFGPDGTLYVVEMDEASWAAVELGIPGVALGGTVNACDANGGGCTEIATGLSMPTAIVADKKAGLFVTVNSLIPGAAGIMPLP